MKFTCQVDIEQPLEKVIELFDNVDNLKEWQDGFVSFEHLSGTPGEPGARSRMLYKTGKREMELIETIAIKNLPEEFSGVYEHKHMINTMTNRFKAIDANSTHYEVEIEYTELRHFMVKLMAFFVPGMFQKQVQKWLDQFKAFAERS